MKIKIDTTRTWETAQNSIMSMTRTGWPWFEWTSEQLPVRRLGYRTAWRSEHATWTIRRIYSPCMRGLHVLRHRCGRMRKGQRSWTAQLFVLRQSRFGRTVAWTMKTIGCSGSWPERRLERGSFWSEVTEWTDHGFNAVKVEDEVLTWTV